MEYSILASSITPMDIKADEAIKALGSSLIQEGEMKRLVSQAMGINSYSSDILSTDICRLVQLEGILFADLNSKFFQAIYLDIDIDIDIDVDTNYCLTVQALLATLPQEDIDELISSYR